MKTKIMLFTFAFVFFACKENKIKNGGSNGEPQSSLQKRDSAQLKYRFLTLSNSSDTVPDSIVPRYQLIDESTKDPSIGEFKKTIFSALEKNDTQAVLSYFQENGQNCISPEKARIAFDLDSGKNKIEEMKSFFKTNLSNGGYFTENFNATSDSGYTTPGIQFISGTNFGHWCADQKCGVIANEGSDLYDTTYGQQKILAHLMGNEIVGAYKIDSGTTPKWRRIFRHNGQEGVVPIENIQSEDDASIVLHKANGKWKICWVIGAHLKLEPVDEVYNGD